MAEPTASPGSGKPDESLLAELAQAFEPGEEEPSEEGPAAKEPSEEGPAAEEPSEEGPAADEPTPEQPNRDESASGEQDPTDGAHPDDGGPGQGEATPDPDTNSGDVRVIAIGESPGPAGGGGMVGEPTVARRTILIGEGDDVDEQPDTVYLDEQLARDDDSKGTVFIDDDGASDAIAPKDAAQPGIEPRIRQRRIGVRRAAGRRRLKWVAIAAAVVLVLVGGLVAVGSVFTIDSVRVNGAVYTDAEVLEDVVEDLRGAAILRADTSAAEERLEAIPWVESARVHTDFPDGATIEIRERTPLITMQGVDGLFRVLDREGRVLDSIEGQPVAMVLIAGPGTLDVEPGAFAPIGHVAAASLVTKLTPNIRGRVEAILVTPDGSDLRLIIDNSENPSIEVEFGSALGDNDQIEKLVRLERVLEDIGDDPVLVINVSTSEVTVL